MRGVRVDKKRLALYILLIILAVVWISFYGGILPFSCFFFLILYIPYSLCHAIAVELSLRMLQKLSQHRISKHKTHHLQVVFENAGFLPLSGIRLLWEDRLCVMHDDSYPRTISLKPGERISFSIPMSCHYAGTYPIGIHSYEISDPLLLITYRFVCGEQFRAIVKPGITDVAAGRLSEASSVATSLKDKNKKEDIPEVDMRAYVPGDSFRSINWKYYARSGELFVRLPEDRDLSEVHVILQSADISESDFRGSLSHVIRRDLFLEYAVSVAHWFVQQGRAVQICYPSGSLRLQVVDGYDSLKKLIETMPEEISHPHGEGVDEKLSQHELDLRARGERLLILAEEGGDGFWLRD